MECVFNESKLQKIHMKFTVASREYHGKHAVFAGERFSCKKALGDSIEFIP